MTDPATPLTLPACAPSSSEKGHRDLNGEATSDGLQAPQVLFYTCVHVTDAATGVRIGWVPAGAHLKEVLTVCPECAGKARPPKRLPPRPYEETPW